VGCVVSDTARWRRGGVTVEADVVASIQRGGWTDVIVSRLPSEEAAYGNMLTSRLPSPQRKASMTVLKQHHAPGMPAEVYDQVAAGAMPSQRQADGFVAHYAIVEDGGITVIEIWDSIDQHDAWFNEVVKPHLPPDTPEPKFAELHNSNTK
jgi:hypothetical protein